MRVTAGDTAYSVKGVLWMTENIPWSIVTAKQYGDWGQATKLVVAAHVSCGGIDKLKKKSKQMAIKKCNGQDIMHECHSGVGMWNVGSV